MGEFLENIYNLIINVVNSSSFYGPLFACFLIFIESILPLLPLFVFITIIFIAYGYVIGFIVAYILTCLGCFFSFYLIRTVLKKLFNQKIRKLSKIEILMQKIDKISLSNLVLLIAIPFTPAFLINIAASLSEMKFKKFAIAIWIGKVSLVFFWGFIGTSLLESLKNPRIIIIIMVMLLIAYIISKIVTKQIDIE